jgi:TetR/AcrR family transcriptional repressor of nem operon
MSRNLQFIPDEKIAKALNVFWKKGYNATSMQDLVNAMQINRSSLYNSFGDKHSLFMACLGSYGLLTSRDYESVTRQKNLTPLQTVEKIIDKIADITVKRENSCLGVQSSFELASHDPQICQFIKQGSDKTLGLLKDLILAAQNSGEISSASDPGVLANYIFNSFAGWRQSYIIYKDAKLVKNMASVLKAGLKG